MGQIRNLQLANGPKSKMQGVLLLTLNSDLLQNALGLVPFACKAKWLHNIFPPPRSIIEDIRLGHFPQPELFSVLRWLLYDSCSRLVTSACFYQRICIFGASMTDAGTMVHVVGKRHSSVIPAA